MLFHNDVSMNLQRLAETYREKQTNKSHKHKLKAKTVKSQDQDDLSCDMFNMSSLFHYPVLYNGCCSVSA